jgi:hypothetical protein
MIRILGLSSSYSPALLAQNSIQDIIRILNELTSGGYDPTTAQVQACIYRCLRYLSQSFVCSDGCSFVAHALHAGILPPLIRSSKWMSPGSEGHVSLRTVLEVISHISFRPLAVCGSNRSYEKRIFSIKSILPSRRNSSRPVE